MHGGELMATTICTGCLLPFGLTFADGSKVERSESMPNSLCESCCDEWKREEAETQPAKAVA